MKIIMCGFVYGSKYYLQLEGCVLVWEAGCKNKGGVFVQGGRQSRVGFKGIFGRVWELNLSFQILVFIYFWENLNVFENWIKIVNLGFREKRNVCQFIIYVFVGFQRFIVRRLRGIVQGCGFLLLFLFGTFYGEGFLF